MEYCQAPLCPPPPRQPWRSSLYPWEMKTAVWKHLRLLLLTCSFLNHIYPTSASFVSLLQQAPPPSPKPPTIIPASPPLPYKWVEANLSLLCGCVLHQVRPLLKQLRWTRFLCCFWKPCQAFFLFYFDCIERLHYPPHLKTTHPPQHTQPRAPPCIEGSGVSGFVFVVVSPWAD